MRFNKKSKGVISVFLLITFSITFVFAGLLVDGGRVRMAKTLAESSLDNASASVLSYYNELLFDMYGLFAVDAPDEAAIQARMDQYFEQTLGLVPGDHSELKQILNDSIANGYFDGYDFQVEEITAGSELNLGQVYVTESQIVEHMKYRGPLQLIDPSFGFLQNLEGILQMKDRLSAAKEKNTITKRHKKTINSGGDLVEALNTFRDELIAFTNNPFNNGLTIEQAVEQYDNDIEYYFTEYCEIQKKIKEEQDKLQESESSDVNATEANSTTTAGTESSENSGSNNTNDTNSTIESLQQEADDILTQRDERIEEWHTMWTQYETHVAELYQEDKDLKVQVDTYISKMETYINELENKCNASGGNEDYKTVFEPEIELSKATVGEVIANKGVLLKAELYLNHSQLDVNQFHRNVDNIIEQKFEDASNKYGQSSWGSNFLKNKLNQETYLKDVTEKFNNLKAIMNDFTYTDSPTQSPTVKPDTQKVKELGEDKQQPGMQTINAALLNGAVCDGTVASGDNSDPDDIYGDGDDAADQAFDKGIALLDELTTLIERGRDTLYIDEYILSNFRNYVHHENMKADLSGTTQKEGTKETSYDTIIAEKFLEAPYTDKEYMVGEVEYILAGNTNQYANVAFVSSEILLIRTAFNMGAMFTDTSMYQQASTIASATGIFAPLATFALMVAWAVAESVLDVVSIINGEKVLLFKRGKDWQLSVQGAINNMVGEVYDFTVSAIESAVQEVVSNYYNQIETKYDAALYDYYVASENLQSGLNQVAAYSNQLPGLAGTKAGSDINKLVTSVNSGLGSTDSYINKINSEKDRTIANLSESYKQKKQDIRQKIVSSANGLPTPEIAFKTGSSDVDDALKVELGYSDYLRLLLLMENSEKKMQRVQQVIQINMIEGEKQTDFKMINAKVNVWADATVSVKYLFMAEAFVPVDLRKDGRYQFDVHTNRSY